MSLMRELISDSAEMTIGIAKEFCAGLSGASKPRIVLLVGDLGAGKTTFMKGVGEYFGVKEDITSPTFVIERIYDIPDGKFKRLVHIDAYRIEKEEELRTIGWERYSSDSGNIIFIEWPANMRTELSDAKKIEFFHQDETTRKIIFHD